MAALNAERRKGRGVGLGTNVLFFVSILIAFVVFMYALNRGAPKSVSPFAGGPAPTMGAGGESEANPGASGEAKVSGTVVVAAELAATMSTEGTLFLILRSSGMPAVGPPLAVKRYSKPQFPLQFEIGTADVMMAGMPLDGPFDLTVRLDRDGNAMSKDPNDLTTADPPTGIAAGATGVELVLSRTLAAAGAKKTLDPQIPPEPAVGAERFSARIEVAGPLANQIPPTGIVYVVVRPSGLPAAGPPLAVKRLSDPEFPLVFEVGPEDVMMKGMPFAGPFDVSVRLDADGDAMTKTPGDLEHGVAPAPVDLGGSVTIVLDRRR